MGCWGITAFESDAGLDAVEFIRRNLSKDGKMKLEDVIKALHRDSWNAPSDVHDAESHTSPMALAEMIVKFLNQELEDMDYDEEWAVEDNKFNTITSFSASKESIRWLQTYLSDMLLYARENEAEAAKNGRKWNGWFKEENWTGWQEHMKMLVCHLEELLALPGDSIELVTLQDQEKSPGMGIQIEH